VITKLLAINDKSSFVQVPLVHNCKFARQKYKRTGTGIQSFVNFRAQIRPWNLVFVR
jgi:hypothetical protein